MYYWVIECYFDLFMDLVIGLAVEVLVDAMLVLSRWGCREVISGLSELLNAMIYTW